MESQSLHDTNSLLAQLIHVTGEPGNLDNTLQHIARIARKFFAADSCVIFRMNPITGKFIPSLTTIGELIRGESSFKEPSTEGLAKQVLLQGMLLVEDLNSQPEYQNSITSSEDIHAFAALALHTSVKQKPLGVLYLNFRKPRRFEPAEQELLQIFTYQAAFILQEAWLIQRYQMVAQIGQDINHDLTTPQNLFERLQKDVYEILDTSFTLLLAVYQHQTNKLDLYIKDKERILFMNDTSLAGACKYVVENQRSVFVGSSEDAKTLPYQRVELIETEHRESGIFVPLIMRGLSLGVLSIQHEQPDAFDQEDQFILELLGTHIALALHNVRLYESLSQLNETGQLLTQQPDQEQILQATAEKIHQATKADLVVLYPFFPIEQRFVLPPLVAGDLQHSTSLNFMSPSQPDDIAIKVLQRVKALFCKESTELYIKLLGEQYTSRERFAERERILSTAAVPLRVGDVAVGALFVNFRQPQRFDATQKLFIEGLAHYAAIAIKNAQVFGSLIQRRVHELETLQIIDRELSRSLELDVVLNTLILHASRHVPADEVAILLYNARTQELFIPAALGRDAEKRLSITLPLQEARGITLWVLEHKKPVRVGDVKRDLPWKNFYRQVMDEILSEMDVPLLDGDEVVGILNFESTKQNAFRQEDLDFVLTLAGQAVVAIQKAQAFERERRLAQEYRSLNQISQEIIGKLDYISVFDLILEKALELTNSLTGTLELYDSNEENLKIVAERGVIEEKRGQRLSLKEGIVGYVARTKELQNVNDLSQPPWNEMYVSSISDSRSELAVPMCAGQELRGVLNIESPVPHKFDRRDENLLTGLANLAVVALQNAERYDEAKTEAKRFELLSRAGQELGEISELKQVRPSIVSAYDIAFEIAREKCNGLVTICEFDQITRDLVLIRTSNTQNVPPYERINLYEGIYGLVAREKHRVVLPDILKSALEVTPKLTNPDTRSLIVIPIKFKDRYYGNLAIGHSVVNHFSTADVNFFDSLAQQLASTIYRLEIGQEHQAFEQRALAAEEMSSIGQSAFELTHRLGNDLGLVESYVGDIEMELEERGYDSPSISKKLDKILRAVRSVLDLSGRLKSELAKSRAADATAGEPVIVSPGSLLDEVRRPSSLPSNILIDVEVDDDVADIRVVHNLAVDILHNLVANAIEAMPDGGKITLRARNEGRSVAIEVVDSGGGIPKQQTQKIFDLFFSTKSSSGFGLWSARRNALRNHGELRVDSKPGQGTTFTLFLPSIEK